VVGRDGVKAGAVFVSCLVAVASGRRMAAERPGSVVYDEAEEAVVISSGSCRLRDVAKAIGNPMIFYWDGKKEAVCLTHLYIRDGGKLIIGREPTALYPWDGAWVPQEKLRITSIDRHARYTLVVQQGGALHVMGSEICGFCAKGGANIEKSCIKGDILLDYAEGRPARKTVTDSLIQGKLTPRGRLVRAEGCRIVNRTGAGVAFWSSCHEEKVIRDCLIEGKDCDINVSHAWGTLVNCTFDFDKVNIRGYSNGGKDYLSWLRVKRELELTLLDGMHRPIEGAVLKATDSSEEDEYQHTSEPTDGTGKTKVELLEAVVSMAGRNGRRGQLLYQHALQIKEKGASEFVPALQNVKLPEKNSIVIERAGEGYEVK